MLTEHRDPVRPTASRARRRTWTVRPVRPRTRPQPNAGNWQIGPKAVNFFAGTSTSDSLLLGFGLEQVTAPADRAKLMKQALSGLGVR